MLKSKIGKNKVVAPVVDDVIDYESMHARIAEILTQLAGDAMLGAEQAEALKEEQESLHEILEKAGMARPPTDEELDDSIEALQIRAGLNELRTAPSGLGTNSPAFKDTPDNCIPNEAVDYNPAPEDEHIIRDSVDYDAKAEVTVGDLLDMHRMLSYCLRGNQRPAVLRVQQLCVKLLPEGTAIIHREP